MARTYFENLPSTNTPLRAERLNGLLNGEESIEKLVVGDIECKNLVSLKSASSTVAGVNIISNSDASIILNGTSTAEILTTNDFYKNNLSFTLDAGTYIFSEKNSYTTIPIVLKKYSDNSNIVSVGSTFTLSETTKVYIGMYIYQKTFNNQKIGLQVEIGDTVTDYTTHKKFGYDSVNSMGDIVVDDIRCKNIFNINGNVNVQGNNGSQVSKNTVENEKLTSNVNDSSSHSVGQKYTNLQGKTITFSATVDSNGGGTGGIIAIYDNGSTSSSRSAAGTENERISVTYTCQSNNIICGFSTRNGTNARFRNIQVEINDSATTYTPHKTFDATGHVLWDNPSPTSSFAGQSITLNDSILNYAYYEILFKQAASIGRIKSSGKIPVYLLTELQNNGTVMQRRIVTTLSGTTMTFAACTYYATYGSGTETTNNELIIPYQVLGYK